MGKVEFDIVVLDSKLKVISLIWQNLLFIFFFILMIPSVDFQLWLRYVLVVLFLLNVSTSRKYLKSAITIGSLHFEEGNLIVSINNNNLKFLRSECEIKLFNVGYKGMNTANPFTMVGFFSSHSGNVLMKVKNQNSSLKYHLQVSNKYEYNELMKNVKKGD